MNWEAFISTHEASIRLSFFIGTFALMAIWEMLAPKRILTVSKLVRWVNNISLVFLNTLLLRLIFPTAAIGIAAYAADHQWGVLHQIQLTLPVAILLSILALDLVIYLQHVLIHAIPLFWRFHRVHHADLDYDVTTGIRFHPVEILFSMVIKFGAIILLGPPLLAVVMFEILLNAMSMFNHGNVRLPKSLDTALRCLVVTPDMHRVHHSVEDNETNSNFGFNLSCWDRLFGTYIAQPRAGHEMMRIGIHHLRNQKHVTWLPGILALPLIGKVTGYAINRRSWSAPDEH